VILCIRSGKALDVLCHAWMFRDAQRYGSGNRGIVRAAATGGSVLLVDGLEWGVVEVYISGVYAGWMCLD